MKTPSTPALIPREGIEHPSPAMEGIESVDKMLDTIDSSSFEEVMKERNRVSWMMMMMMMI
jgi:hypothetical protein